MLTTWQMSFSLVSLQLPFTPIAFSEQDIGKTYLFTVTEQMSSTPAKNITYDSWVIAIPLTIALARDGGLKALRSYPEDTTFDYIYHATRLITPEGLRCLTAGKLWSLISLDLN